MPEKSKKVLLSALPWNGGLKIKQRGVIWTITVEARFGSGSSSYDPKVFYEHLYHKHIKEMPLKQRLDWDGVLPGDSRHVMSMMRLFSHNKAKVYSSAALLSLYKNKEFNNEVAFSALGELLKDDEDFKRSAKLKGLRKRCQNRFLGIGYQQIPPGNRSAHVHYAATILNTLSDTKETVDLEIEFVDQLKVYLSKTSGSSLPTTPAKPDKSVGNSAFFSNGVNESADVECSGPCSILEYLKQHVSPAIEILTRAFTKPYWTNMLANAVTKSVLTQMKNFQPREQPEKQYNIYIQLKELAQHTTFKDQIQLYETFTPSLEFWADHVISLASEQVDKVIKMERSKHGESEKYWTDWQEEGPEWRESAIAINGIFHTCQLTWRDLTWQDSVESMQYGLRLFKGMHKLFIKYVDDFLHIIMLDDVFNQYEFVIIMLNVLGGMTYLKKTQEMVNEYMEILSSSYSKALNQIIKQSNEEIGSASLEADERAEQLVMEFCNSQVKAIDKFVKADKLTGGVHEFAQTHLLPWLNNLFRFLNEHLEFEASQTHFKRMVHSEMFTLCEKRIHEHFKTLLQKRKKETSGFAQIIAALPDLNNFRKEMHLEPSQILAEIEKDLYPRCSPTCDLINHQMALIKPLDPTMGDVTFRTGFIESTETLIVQLKSVENLRPRSGDEYCNFSVTVAVFPVTKEPFILTNRTQPHKQKNELDFELDIGDENSGRFVFHLPNRSYSRSAAFITVDLYHQIPATLHKKFAGHVVLPFEEVNEIDNEEHLKYVSNITRCFRKFEHVDSPEYKELGHRRDKLAKEFVDRYDKHRHGSLRLETSGWAVVKESQYSSDLIAQHYFDIVNKIGEKSEDIDKIQDYVDLQLAWHETKEELLLKIWKFSQKVPRPDQSEVNSSLCLRFVPTKCKEKSTRVYPNSTEVDLEKQQDSDFSFKLGMINYNFHASFLQIILFDNTRSAIPGKKFKRFFRGQVLLPLSDIHPIDATDKFRSVGLKRYPFKPLSITDDFEAWKVLLKRKDDVAKKHVQEVKSFMDLEAIKYPFDKDLWADPVPKLSRTLITDHLANMAEFMDATEGNLGELKFDLKVDNLTVNLELKSIYEVKPNEGESNCNFGIEINVIPSSVSPYR